MNKYFQCFKQTGYFLITLLSIHYFSSLKPAIAETEAICVSNLDVAIEQVIKRPEFRRSRWGILIKTLDNQETLYNLDEQYYFLPASNLKLLTTAAALYELGSQFRISTSVYGTGELPNLTTLRLVGRGDPSLTTNQLRKLARELKYQGVRRIEQLIVEDSYFSDSPINPTWEWEDIHYYYGVPVNSLMLNENTVLLTIQPQASEEFVKLQWSDPIAARQWQVDNQVLNVVKTGNEHINISTNLGGSNLKIQGEVAIDTQPQLFGLAIVDPSNYALESFYRLLLNEGISVAKRTLSQNQSLNPASEVELTTIESPPLEDIIAKINKESNNLYAEALLKILEKESQKTLEEILTELGVEPESYVLVDGSGLSRHNLVSPEDLVQILTIMAKSPQAEVYRNSLAEVGEKGTLQNRWQDTTIKIDLQAKTGYMTGVSALSGYLNPSDYPSVVFSIIINQSSQSGATLQQAIDEIILLLARLKSC